MADPEQRTDWGFKQPFSDAHLFRWLQKRTRQNHMLTVDQLASEAAKTIRSRVLAMLSKRTGLELLNARYQNIGFIRRHGKGLRAVFANSFDAGHPRFGRGKWLDRASAGRATDVLFLWEPKLYLPVRPGPNAPAKSPRPKRLSTELRLLDKLVDSARHGFKDWPVVMLHTLDRQRPIKPAARPSWVVPDGPELRRVTKTPTGPGISESALGPLVSFFYGSAKVTTKTQTVTEKDGTQFHRWYIIGPGRMAIVIRRTRG